MTILVGVLKIFFVILYRRLIAWILDWLWITLIDWLINSLILRSPLCYNVRYHNFWYQIIYITEKRTYIVKTSKLSSPYIFNNRLFFFGISIITKLRVFFIILTNFLTRCTTRCTIRWVCFGYKALNERIIPQIFIGRGSIT